MLRTFSGAGIVLAFALMAVGCGGDSGTPAAPPASSGSSASVTSGSPVPSTSPDVTDGVDATPGIRDWDSDLTAHLAAAGVNVTGSPESAFDSSFLAGQYRSHAVLAKLFLDPVHGLRGQRIEALDLGGASGTLFDATARSYVEFSCGPDTLQVSVFSTSDPRSSFSKRRSVQLARAIATSGSCS